MARYSCCLWMPGRKKDKMVGEKMSNKVDDFNKALRSLKVGPAHPVKPLKIDELKTASTLPASDDMPNNFATDREISHKTPTKDEAPEVAYEGEDEHDENVSLKRDLSDMDLQSFAGNSSGYELSSDRRVASFNSFAEFTEQNKKKAEKNDEGVIDIIQSGHASDPGIGKARFCDSPKLKRSCSNLETSKTQRVIAEVIPASKLLYYGESQEQSEKWRTPGSPASIRSHWSADKVILRKHSSSQVLPSRSRKLWWKLFLWSHRNLHKLTEKQQQQPQPIGTDLNQQGGYHSDTVEQNRAMMLSRTQSPESFIGESLNKNHYRNGGIRESWSGIGDSFSGFWPQNRWVAFPTESTSYSRVDEWVKDLENQMPPPDDDYDDDSVGSDEGIIFPPSPLKDKSPLKSTAAISPFPDNNLSEDILIANSVIQSLNSSTTVAHVSSIGLKAAPIMSHFFNLRSVDLSNNSIICITPGSFPKGLHVLNLSRNKISTIEGLRELTRLRVLDLSYNRISRIGQGLSNCTMIKELSLAGNKISNVEGLHRLLKLTVLDLSFNKITTAKALGQLVANYHSLQALNLLGNPIQTNIGNDHLHKAVCSLLPKLVYLNKQPIKSHRAREVVTDGVAKAALGTKYNNRRKAARRVSSGASSSGTYRSSGSVTQRSSRNRSRSRSSYPKATQALHAYSSR